MISALISILIIIIILFIIRNASAIILNTIINNNIVPEDRIVSAVQLSDTWIKGYVKFKRKYQYKLAMKFKWLFKYYWYDEMTIESYNKLKDGGHKEYTKLMKIHSRNPVSIDGIYHDAIQFHFVWITYNKWVQIRNEIIDIVGSYKKDE